MARHHQFRKTLHSEFEPLPPSHISLRDNNLQPLCVAGESLPLTPAIWLSDFNLRSSSWKIGSNMSPRPEVRRGRHGVGAEASASGRGGSPSESGNVSRAELMVEAAGVEPAPPQNANWLMARDFRRNCLTTRCLVANLLCSGVLWCALESSPVLETSWRRSCRRDCAISRS